MNTEIKIFESEQFGAIRTVVMDENSDEVWFVGKDVAKVLGYNNPTKAIIMHVDDKDKELVMIEAESQNGTLVKTKTAIINESGLYSLILSSKLETAKEFKHWVTSVVLPQIRKTGGYIPVREEDDEKTILCKAILIYQRTLEEKNELLKKQVPYVRFANAVTSCPDSILIRDLAKLLTQNGVKIGQARLFYWLRLHGYLFQRETRPIQKWVEEGIFDTNETVVGGLTKLTTKVTGKGQRYFIEGFLSGRFKADNLSLSRA